MNLQLRTGRSPVATIPLAVLKDGKLSLVAGAIGNGPRVMFYRLFSMLDTA